MSRLIIIEDEEKIGQLLVDYAAHSGYQATHFTRGLPGLEAIRQGQADLVLLDLMLPDGDGLDICRKIREFSALPIIIISARVDELDRLLGLELGADDYICKPFSPREVMARVKAVLRRFSTTDTPASRGLVLDDDRLEAMFDGQRLALTAVEFALLKTLAEHPGHIRSRQQLMDRIYNDHRVVSDRTIDSHVKKLRQKLAEKFGDIQFIDSVYGAGYRLGSLTLPDKDDSHGDS